MGTIGLSGKNSEETEYQVVVDNPRLVQLRSYLDEFSQLTRSTENQLRSIIAQWQEIDTSTSGNDNEANEQKLFYDFYSVLVSTGKELQIHCKRVEDTIQGGSPARHSHDRSPEVEHRKSGPEVICSRDLANPSIVSNFPSYLHGSLPQREAVNHGDAKDKPASTLGFEKCRSLLPRIENEDSRGLHIGSSLIREENDAKSDLSSAFAAPKSEIFKSYFTDDESSENEKSEAGARDGKPFQNQSSKHLKSTQLELPCAVRLKKLPGTIVDRAKRGTVVITTSTEPQDASDHLQAKNEIKSREHVDLHELVNAVRRLKNFDGRVEVNPNGTKYSRNPESTSTSVEMNISDIEDASIEAANIFDKLSSTPFPNNQDTDVETESGSSDSDLLNAGVDSEDDLLAKKEVLMSCSEKTSSDKEADLNSIGNANERSCKIGGDSYFLPAVCRIPKCVSGESSSEESVIVTPLHDQKEAVKKRRSHESDHDGKNETKIGLSLDHANVEKKSRKAVTLFDLSTDEDVDCKSNILVDDSQPPKRKRSKRQWLNVVSSDSDDDDFRRKRKSRSDKTPSQENSIYSGASGLKTGIHRPNSFEKLDAEAGKGKGANVGGSDSFEESQNSQRGRKNIRGIIEDRSALARETQAAANEEEERQLRLARKRAELKKSSIGEKEILLDIQPFTKRVLVSVDHSIVRNLKPHQAEGIKFLWNNCFESVELSKKQGSQGGGCILAHCMGLGKTLQAIAFIHTILTNKYLNVKRILIICPLNTVHNWYKEFGYWLQETKNKIDVFKLYEMKSFPLERRINHLEAWREVGGVGIIHYDLFRNLVRGNILIEASKQARIDECLLDPGADVVICDEGHIMKNFQSRICIALNRVRTKRRIILTGTPLQNNLMEYHTMMHFVKPHLLGTRKEFANRFANPITNGQHRDSTSRDVFIMKKRAHVLHKVLDPSVQRRDYSILVPFLPPKFEYAVVINMAEIQIKLYNHYLNLISGGTYDEVKERIRLGFFLGDFATLSKIWSHPFNLSLRRSKERKSLKKVAIEEQDVEDKLLFDDENEVGKPLRGVEVDPFMQKKTEEFNNRVGQWWLEFFPNPNKMKALEYSSKLILLQDILKSCALIGDKVLVFSQYLYSLNLIEDLMKAMDKESCAAKEKHENTRQVFTRWRKGKEYFRIDGSVRSEDRQKFCEEFNSSNSGSHVFLVSTKAGGVGINLVGANRVVIFDASFNPSNDVQAIFRVFRFGQKKPCYIYRLLAKGTMEEKVYNRQVVKLSLSGRVVDEMQIERHYTVEELVKMYDPVPEGTDNNQGRIPCVPKDKLLADFVSSDKYVNLIHNYFEHDSLLENQIDEKLTEEERKLAWEEYKKEKDGESLLLQSSLGDFLNLGDHNYCPTFFDSSAFSIEAGQASSVITHDSVTSPGTSRTSPLTNLQTQTGSNTFIQENASDRYINID